MERIINTLQDMTVCVTAAQKMVQQDLTGCQDVKKASCLMILFGALIAVQGAIQSALVCAQQTTSPKLVPVPEAG